jgi:hypothetical protein
MATLNNLDFLLLYGRLTGDALPNAISFGLGYGQRSRPAEMQHFNIKINKNEQ